MNRKLSGLLAGCLLLVAAIPAFAHHSTAHYDFVKPGQATGVVKLISAANPHLRLVLEIEDDKGKRDITYEGHSLNHYIRAGWAKGKVVSGDRITINYSPVRGGADGGYVTAILTAKGEWIRVGAPIQ